MHIFHLRTKDPKMKNILKTQKFIKCKEKHKSRKSLLTNVKLYTTTMKPTIKNVDIKTVEHVPIYLNARIPFSNKERVSQLKPTLLVPLESNLCNNLLGL